MRRKLNSNRTMILNSYRRNTMKSLFSVLAAAFVLSGFLFAQPAESESLGSAGHSKPNIVFIVGDDCGFNEFSFQGGSIPTPRIDSIASGGVTCTQGYVSAAVCAPSRAGLLTGRYQQRFGFLGNLPMKQLSLEGLPLKETMLPELLGEAGYRNIAIGKWHLGWDPKFHPCARGFDDFYGFLHGSRSYFPIENPPSETKLLLNRESAGPDGFKYITDEFGERTAGYIDRYKDEPFFLYVAFNATHSPSDALQEDLATIEGKVIPAMAIALDRAVGNILDALDRNQLAENTLIVFISDNGGVEKHNNKPLRGYKRDMYEGGIRVPFAIRWPKVLPAGATYDYPVISLDLFTTSLDAAGIAAPAEKSLDGVDLVPYLTGENTQPPHQTLYWTHGDTWAVRDGDLKLVLSRKHKGPPELFDLAKDVSEKNDLADQQPDTVQRLKLLFDQWNAKNKPSLWERNKNGDRFE